MKVRLFGKTIDVSEKEYQVLLRADPYLFMQRSFYELNPQTPFLPNWHIERLPKRWRSVGPGRQTVNYQCAAAIAQVALHFHCISRLGTGPQSQCAAYLCVLRPGSGRHVGRLLPNANVQRLLPKPISD